MIVVLTRYDGVHTSCFRFECRRYSHISSTALDLIQQYQIWQARVRFPINLRVVFQSQICSLASTHKTRGILCYNHCIELLHHPLARICNIAAKKRV